MNDPHTYIIARLTDIKLDDVKRFVVSNNINTDLFHNAMLYSDKERKHFTSALAGFEHNSDREEIIKKYRLSI